MRALPSLDAVPISPRNTAAAASVVRAAALAVALCGVLHGADARAQSTHAPGSHWGASGYPRLTEGLSVGFELLGFTEFGKDTNPAPPTSDGTPLTADECRDARRAQGLDRSEPCGVRDRYNHVGETIGLNLLTFNYTHALERFNLRSSNVLFTTTVVLGWVGDTVTEWYQNDVIHRALGLQRIPRDGVACDGGDDDNAWRCGIWGIGGDLTYQVYSLDRGRGRLGMRPTPLFVGGGGMVSNVMSDIHVQFGFRRFELWGEAWPRVNRIVSLHISGVARGGVLAPGAIFDNVASHYAAANASVGLRLAKYRWPINIEFGYTGSTGMFVEQPRTTNGEGDEVQSQRLPLGIAERFYNLRVELGEFAFETYNDSAGGKDKGPSFGARILYTFSPGTLEGDSVYRALTWVRSLFRRDDDA